MPWHKSGLTLALILISVLVSLAIGFGDNREVMRLLTFTDFTVRGQQIYHHTLSGMLSTGQWWRLITPAFMHFSELHLIFNLLWIWIVGSRIEQLHGRWVLLSLFLAAAALSNLAQFMVSGPMFGGMSGVVYAVLGYSWLWDRRGYRPGFGLPQGLMGFMLVWLVLGYLGVLQSVGMGAVANTAHLVGLLVGLLFVLPVRLLRR
ncbi:GlpG protein (membrane protein of glp regulon) [Nitrincola lacisaponensis]|uniref:GlpG protein (Membrane protein of glp regulon) n=1 Tax=Nitrincola lacisaponensis TaxID=267850 RepID=A0A063XYE1_9GAMM|nr:rhomboid family intramembrane serine protease [Nitrincola lacisaponensis]KDE39173.1 GlpG protein (membrane protein of glp regulon) [Nitrincola lacisaponensis]